MSTTDRFVSADTESNFEPAWRRMPADSDVSLQQEKEAQSSLPVPDAAAPQLLQRSSIAHAANAPIRAAAFRRTQQTHGNRVAQRSVARIQAKLMVSEPGDALEQEADHVAELAMTGEECECGGTCEECQADVARRVQAKLSPGAAARRVQRQASDESPALDQSDLDARLAQRAGGGQPLAEGTRSFAESRLGHDFRDVRVHTDAEASDLARSLDAEAFTTGNDIYFRAGKHDPESHDGKRLLTHELTHVVQQVAAPHRIQRQPVESDDDVHVPKEVCGTGEIKGQVYICCYPNPHPYVRECSDLYDRVFKECYDKQPEKDERALDLCTGKAAFETCHCLARHLGKEHCRCSGLV